MTAAQDVAKIAKLARLDIKPDQLEKVSANFSEILEYFTRLKKVDTSGIEPIYHATSIPGDTLAEDVEEPPALVLKEVMKNAPLTRDNQFRVPKVIE